VCADVEQMKVLLREADADKERLKGETENEKSRESAARSDLEEVRMELRDMTERCEQAVEERDRERGRMQQELEEAGVELHNTQKILQETQTQLEAARQAANTPHPQLVRMEKEVGKAIARERQARETLEEASAREKHQMAKMDKDLGTATARERKARDALEEARAREEKHEEVKTGLMREVESLHKTLEETKAQVCEMKKALDQCVIELAESQHKRLAVQLAHEEVGKNSRNPAFFSMRCDK
jgi:chromosome segregation ATPase